MLPGGLSGPPATRFNPKGIVQQSPGLRAASYPGKVDHNFSQPRRGCAASFLINHEDELKVDADEDGNGGDDTADCLRYLVATKARAVAQRKLRGL